MINNIDEPLAVADVRWFTAEEGGRSSGPPTAAVYAATAVFPLGGEQEVTPGWPGSADQVSILVQRIRTLPSGEDSAKIGFLAPELARPHLHAGATILILEGPRTVARAVVREVAAHDDVAVQDD